tara:strand:+ start:530 stop:676 length:147 start_codon:yes stop_codon:yes gene_type:complete
MSKNILMIKASSGIGKILLLDENCIFLETRCGPFNKKDTIINKNLMMN